MSRYEGDGPCAPIRVVCVVVGEEEAGGRCFEKHDARVRERSPTAADDASLLKPLALVEH
jgi:hypothetical protein